MNNKQIEEIIERLGDTTRLGKALLEHQIGPRDKAILDALEQYQNEDGGFGHGLEADIQMPHSSVASTDIAISILEEIVDSSRKEQMKQKIVTYLESVYDKDTCSVPIVGKEVDSFPHAVWWNSDALDGFTYGNPNPEVLGFLLENRHYVKHIDLDRFVAHMLDYIKHKMKEEASMHSVLSLCQLYKRAQEDLKNEIKDYVLLFIHQFVELNPEKWDDYVLEPYKVYLIVPELMEGMETSIELNIQKYERLLEDTIVRPNWHWGQYPEVFEEVKDNWTPLIQHDLIRAIKRWRKQ
jgi:hypothetical protein